MSNGKNGHGLTFWQAARDIMAECFEILRPGGVAVWICKDFVRKGKRVPFADDWARLCVACGFVLVRRAHAMLVQTWSENTLFDGIVPKEKKKASFFRRLAEAKGSPKIDHEDVLFMEKPRCEPAQIVGRNSRAMESRSIAGPALPGSFGYRSMAKRRRLSFLSAAFAGKRLPIMGAIANQRKAESISALLGVGVHGPQCPTRSALAAMDSNERRQKRTLFITANPGRPNQSEREAANTIGIIEKSSWSASENLIIGQNKPLSMPTAENASAAEKRTSNFSPSTTSTAMGLCTAETSARVVESTKTSSSSGSPRTTTDFSASTATSVEAFTVIALTSRKMCKFSTSGRKRTQADREQSPESDVWTGCYDDGWQGAIVPEAFAHPAKAARGLLRRIFDELERMGAVWPGARCVDPFFGVGTTGIEGASRGVQVFGCELEPKFIGLAEQNIELHRPSWTLCRCPLPVLVQGDSRELRKHLAGVLAEAVVGSPPFQGSIATFNSDFIHVDGRPNRAGTRTEIRVQNDSDYGTSTGQLGAMSPGSIEAVISSPPYVAQQVRSNDVSHSSKERDRTRHGGRGFTDEGGGTFADPAQLSAMPPGSTDCVVSSPPYAAIATGAGGLNTKPPKHPGQQGGRSATSASQDTDQKYGDSPGQLSRMREGAIP